MARPRSKVSRGFVVECSSAGYSIITVARRDDSCGWIGRFGQRMRHYAVRLEATRGSGPRGPNRRRAESLWDQRLSRSRLFVALKNDENSRAEARMSVKIAPHPVARGVHKRTEVFNLRPMPFRSVGKSLSQQLRCSCVMAMYALEGASFGLQLGRAVCSRACRSMRRRQKGTEQRCAIGYTPRLHNRPYDRNGRLGNRVDLRLRWRSLK